METEMPRPGAEHRALIERMVGSWDAEERMLPSPWDPVGGTAEARIEAREGLDGFHVITDYVQRRNGGESFRGHGVYGWDASRERYTMYWFDSMGSDPGGPVLGTLEGDVLTFARDTPRGKSRYVYTFAGDRYDFRIEASSDGETWTTFMDSTYRRA